MTHHSCVSNICTIQPSQQVQHQGHGHKQKVQPEKSLAVELQCLLVQNNLLIGDLLLGLRVFNMIAK